MADVIVSVGADDSQLQAVLANSESKIHEVGQKSLEMRNQVMRDVRTGMGMVSTLMSAMHIATRILRLQLNPFQTALLSLIGTTVMTMQSVAAAMSTTVVGIPAALIISSAAMGLQIGVSIEIFNEMNKAKMTTMQISENTANARAEIRSVISGLGGF